MEKDESIRAVVAKMLAVYGNTVHMTDHWPDDPLGPATRTRGPCRTFGNLQR